MKKTNDDKKEQIKPASTSVKSKVVAAPQVTAKASASTKPKSAVKPKASAKTKPALPAAKTADKPKAAKAKSTAKEKAIPAAKEKIKKAKLVRDSFTMPEAEYAALGEVKKLCLKAGIEVKKSELLRIGVAHIRQLSLPDLKKSIASLVPLKAGRPKKEK
jgi:hypothetical protein